jgi:hypothetical protein
MAKLKWKVEDEGVEVAWVGNGVDASPLEVDSTVDPERGFRWCAWSALGFAPTLEEAKLEAEDAAKQLLRAALESLDPGIEATGKVNDIWLE